MKFRMFFADTLFRRIAGIILINVVVIQLVTFAFFRAEQMHRGHPPHDLSERIMTAVSVFEVTPIAERKQLAINLSIPGLLISTSAAAPGPALDPPDMPTRQLLRRISADLARGGMVTPDDIALTGISPPLDGWRPIAIDVRLADGSFADFILTLPPPPPFRWLRVVGFIAIVSSVIVGFSLLVAGRLSRRLDDFAAAALALGRSAEAPPLPESGPRELRRATHAFNEMQERLRRFVSDRTQMLAAISHDLRTPLTRLRLRAEFVEDEDQRERMLHDLTEMEQMISATLAFARDDAAPDRREQADLDTLIRGLVAERAEAGQPLTYRSDAAPLVTCNRLALRRALGNLLDNAVKYGMEAKVSLAVSGTLAHILIEDEGPGIPESLLEQVFQPFFRLEASRNRDTGGVGLGLSVARTILRGHGGDLVLRNRAEGGLCAAVTLPV